MATTVVFSNEMRSNFTAMSSRNSLSDHVRLGLPSDLFPAGFSTKIIPATCPIRLGFVTCNNETIILSQLVAVFIVNLCTKFQRRISSALFVTFIKAT